MGQSNKSQGRASSMVLSSMDLSSMVLSSMVLSSMVFTRDCSAENATSAIHDEGSKCRHHTCMILKPCINSI